MRTDIKDTVRLPPPVIDGLVVELPPWRERLSHLPHELWLRWRHRATELLSDLGRPAIVAEIREADRLAALEVQAEIDRNPDGTGVNAKPGVEISEPSGGSTS